MNNPYSMANIPGETPDNDFGSWSFINYLIKKLISWENDKTLWYQFIWYKKGRKFRKSSQEDGNAL